ncbi:Uncharacterised protein [Enterobacter hormaechei]|nr:hypothetical protein AZZ90_003667 [Enterobacter hormaechei]CZZ80694.1 Uncharacterised protein [Enterobacter hormaechei]SAE28620.1 Uncharacterised protein [Enterobacter hormaechei]SAG82477.1 Uncharacterised protein [Enterobacter hormaechei]
MNLFTTVGDLTILGLRNIHNLRQHQKQYNKLF